MWLAVGLPLGLLTVGLLLEVGISFWIDSTWFSVLGYFQVWWLSWIAPFAIGVATFLILVPLLNRTIHQAWSQETESKKNQTWRSSIVLLLSASMAGLLAYQWLILLIGFHPTPMGTTDPVFGRDIGFYLFRLPALEALQTWCLTLAFLIFVLIGLIYVRRFTIAALPERLAIVVQAQKHLLFVGGVLFLCVAWEHWLSRYTLLYSTRGSISGANYTDVNAQIPANTFLVWVSCLTALGFFFLTLRRADLGIVKTIQGQAIQWNWRQLFAVLILLAGYGFSVLLIGRLYPAAVQALMVLPNELERDRPYIQRNLQFTRQGFNLTKIEPQSFKIQDSLTLKDLQANAATIKNIRLWEDEPLLETYRQLQEIRPYYQFPAVDTDRYTIDGVLRQVMHAAREIDHTLIPERAQTWVNLHFFYTHGYGLTLSPVNVVTRVGLPDFFIKDIPPRSTNPAIEKAIPINKPAIYYGELTNTNVFVNTRALELDFPKEDVNIYGSYQGEGGLPAGQFWQRLLYAWHFRDLRIPLSQEFTADSKFLIYRDVVTRVRKIAPFLRYDSDPYLVAAGGNFYWVIDAYTTSDRFPYSDPASSFDSFNYIRNAVKVVVNAYSGSVDFYVADPDDAIVQTYQRIYPTLFQPLDQIPAFLRQHLRYPADLFRVQTQQYAAYHMDDPQVFYNKEDLWQIPLRVKHNRTRQESSRRENLGFSSESFSSGKLQPMSPYYLVLNLPDPDVLTEAFDQTNQTRTAEFVLLSPFTPANKQNLIAWMAARCDGENYGKLVVYEFSRQSLIFGPQQVEARINQNPLISEQISLWNQQGSRVNQGNLLVIPVEHSLLYVQPLYLEAESSRLPQLTRVIVAYEDQVVMEPTLDAALQKIFTVNTAAQQTNLSRKPTGNPQIELN
jgi:uncharacterized membrane protein (UPF0182 family)